tara:strand:+ start:479 stop:1231 length:753 start_codon:yes stop_codon:yes gene_type:complete
MGLGIGNGNANLWTNKVDGSSPPSFSNLYSMYFNGIDQFLNGSATPLLGNLGTGDWSISFWFKADNISTGGNQRILSLGTGGTLHTQIYITTTGTLQVSGPWSDGYNFSALSNTWYHVIYRVNTASASQNVGYVINGTDINNKNESITTTFDTTGNAYIGRNSGSFGFEGNIDEFSIWNKYLTNADCIEIYNGGTPNDLSTVSAASNLQNWWRMGDPSGTASYPTISAAAGPIVMTMSNMTSANIETDIP